MKFFIEKKESKKNRELRHSSIEDRGFLLVHQNAF
jgi:hypothetical protein